MARFLLDTNVVSEPTFKQPNQYVISRIDANQSDIAISSTILHELIFGCERLPESKKRTHIERYIKEVIFNSIPIFAYDDTAARWHASERARLTSIGKTPAYADAQIAAVAAVNRLILVTRNISDFKDFEGIDIVNWYE